DDFDRAAIAFVCQFIGGIFGQSRGSPCADDREPITRAGYARFGAGVGSSDFTRTVVNRAVLKKQRGCWTLQSVTETPVSLIGQTRQGAIEIRNVVKPGHRHFVSHRTVSTKSGDGKPDHERTL